MMMSEPPGRGAGRHIWSLGTSQCNSITRSQGSRRTHSGLHHLHIEVRVDATDHPIEPFAFRALGCQLADQCLVPFGVFKPKQT